MLQMIFHVPVVSLLWRSFLHVLCVTVWVKESLKKISMFCVKKLAHSRLFGNGCLSITNRSQQTITHDNGGLER